MGQNFIKKYLKGDLPIWSIIIFICLISMVEMYSAGSQFVSDKDNHTSELIKHSLFLISGAIIAFAIHRMPFKWIRISGYLMLIGSVALLFILAVLPSKLSFIGGVTENDATRWISIFGFKFQPSEFAKLATIIYLSNLLTVDPKKSITLTTIAKFRNKELTDEYAQTIKFIIGMAVLFLVCGLIYKENISTSVLLFGVGITLMFLAKIKPKWLLIVVAFIGVLGFTVIKTEMLQHLGRNSVGLSRINDWLDENDQNKYDYSIEMKQQAIQSQIAIARGGWLGVFPGNSVQRDFLQLAYADFIYAIIVEETGLIGGLIIIAFYLMFLYRAGILAKKSQTNFPAILVLGLTLMIVYQAFISIGVVVRLGPITGQPLPLLSRGGTSIIITWIYIGIIQCVARSINEANERKLTPMINSSGDPEGIEQTNDEETDETFYDNEETEKVYEIEDEADSEIGDKPE